MSKILKALAGLGIAASLACAGLASPVVAAANASDDGQVKTVPKGAKVVKVKVKTIKNKKRNIKVTSGIGSVTVTRGNILKKTLTYMTKIKAKNVTVKYDMWCGASGMYESGLAMRGGVAPSSKSVIHFCATGQGTNLWNNDTLRFTLAHEYGHILQHRHRAKLSKAQQKYLRKAGHNEDVADCTAQVMTKLSATSYGSYVMECKGNDLKIAKKLAKLR